MASNSCNCEKILFSLNREYSVYAYFGYMLTENDIKLCDLILDKIKDKYGDCNNNNDDDNDSSYDKLLKLCEIDGEINYENIHINGIDDYNIYGKMKVGKLILTYYFTPVCYGDVNYFNYEHMRYMEDDIPDNINLDEKKEQFEKEFNVTSTCYFNITD